MAASDKKKRGVVPLVVIAIVVLVPLSAWLLRGTIATSIATSALAERGLTCDERFSVEVAAFFGEATIGPTRCTRQGGLVEAIELTSDAVVELDGLEPAAVRAEGLRVVLRDQDVRGGSGWASQLARINLEQRVAGLVKGLAELSGMGLPPVNVRETRVYRGGDDLATIDQLVLTPGSPTAVAIDRCVFTAVMGAARLTLSDVSGTAAGSTVHLEGEASARAGIALLGSFSTGGTFTLDASALDSASPDLRLRASF